tara:strand:- start:9666 stop:11168 length:1503 start_codon:yes stop_codon:yes gene_type:complete
MRKDIVFLLFIFLLIKGILFVFLIPPWQGPDEPTHFEYIEKFLNDFNENGSSNVISSIIDDSLKKDYLNLRDRTETRIEDYKVQRDIVNSMFEFDFWRLTERPPRFSELDDVEVFQHTSYISSIPFGSEPLYFWITSKAISIFGIATILGKLYLARILSMLLGLLIIFFIYLIAKQIIIDSEERYFAFSAAAFAGFLPQFSFLSATVSSANMANLICAAITYVLILFIKDSTKINQHSGNSPFFYIKLFLIISMILAGLFTKRSTLVIIPTAICSFFFLYEKNGGSFWSRLFYQGRILSLLLAAMFFSILVLYLFDKSLILNLYARLSPVFSNVYNFFNSITNISPAIYFRTFSILFVSFWFSFGWMVYKMSVGWYVLFGAIALLSITGVCRLLYVEFAKNNDYTSKFNGKGIVVLSLLIVFTLFAIVAFRGPAYLEGSSIQGRFIFTALPSIAILFMLGLQHKCPKSFKENAMRILILYMLFLNGISIFKYLIPLFYLN